MSTSVRLNGGAFVFHVVTVYGIAGANEGGEKMVSNEALLEKVLLEAGSLGEAPVLIFGDFNVCLDKSHMLSREHAEGRWFDVAKLLADASGEEPQHTFVTERSMSRIDMAFVNPVAASMLTGFKVGTTEGSRIKDHRPIFVEFETKAAPTYAEKCRRVRSLPEGPPCRARMRTRYSKVS